MATMENLEYSYFNTDYLIGEESYENMLTVDPALFYTSAPISQVPDTHQDLDDILGGLFKDQLGSSSSMLNAGINAWHTQGTSNSPYPDVSYTHRLPIDQHGGGSIANGFGQGFAEHYGVGMQAVLYSENQSKIQLGGIEAQTGTKSGENTIIVELASNSKSEVAPTAADGIQPNPKSQRGPRTRGPKTEEEKKAKKEQILERNRMAASRCRQKKKVATGHIIENFSKLERQNNQMKASVEELKQIRNKILMLLLEHKECSHPAIDKCLELKLAQIAGEIEAQLDTSMCEMDDDTQQFLNSNTSSPSNRTDNLSRRNSITMSRSG